MLVQSAEWGYPIGWMGIPNFILMDGAQNNIVNELRGARSCRL
jgi:hypothetical protein